MHAVSMYLDTRGNMFKGNRKITIDEEIKLGTEEMLSHYQCFLLLKKT